MRLTAIILFILILIMGIYIRIQSIEASRHLYGIEANLVKGIPDRLDRVLAANGSLAAGSNAVIFFSAIGILALLVLRDKGSKRTQVGREIE